MAFRNPGIRMHAALDGIPGGNIGDVLEITANDFVNILSEKARLLLSTNAAVPPAELIDTSDYVPVFEFGAKEGVTLFSAHNDVVLKGGLNAGGDNTAKVRIESERPVLMTTRADDFGQPGSPGHEYVSRNNGTDPTNTPAVIGGVLYVRTRGDNKLELCVRFQDIGNSGNPQTPIVLATSTA